MHSYFSIIFFFQPPTNFSPTWTGIFTLKKARWSSTNWDLTNVKWAFLPLKLILKQQNLWSDRPASIGYFSSNTAIGKPPGWNLAEKRILKNAIESTWIDANRPESTRKHLGPGMAKLLIEWHFPPSWGDDEWMGHCGMSVCCAGKEVGMVMDSYG